MLYMCIILNGNSLLLLCKIYEFKQNYFWKSFLLSRTFAS